MVVNLLFVLLAALAFRLAKLLTLPHYHTMAVVLQKEDVFNQIN